jgi:hypothetical protein
MKSDRENARKEMEKVKCITFDKAAQDALPEHIKIKMKQAREKARADGCLRKLKAGFVFTGKHFTGKVTTIKITGNTLNVKCESKTGGFTWHEDWDLQHVLWGFEQGEYFWTE